MQPQHGMLIIKRGFDIFLAVVLLLLWSIPMLGIVCLVKFTSKGPILYWSKRVGINNTIFQMPKFRTMMVGTPSLATHLLKNPEQYLTPLGRFLRKTSIDELPQLLAILKGDMSFVGPRPALYNQDDLIALRTQKGIHALKPGLTGWAQIHGRDELPILIKVEYDEYYLKRQSILLDLSILWKTVFKVVRGAGIQH